MTRGTWQGSGTWQTSGPDLGAFAGPVAAVVIAAVAVTVIAQIVVWLAVITGVLLVAAIVAVVLVWRRTKRREAAYEASAQHQRLIAATVTPQVTQGTPPAIVNHYHQDIHIHGSAPEQVAAAIRALPGRES